MPGSFSTILSFLGIWCFLGLTHPLRAQSEERTASPWQYHLAYVHNGLVNPGLQVGVEWPFKNMVRFKEKTTRRSGSYLATRRRQLALEARLGFFWDPLTQVGLFNQYLFSYRFVLQKSGTKHPQWMMGVGLGPGYFRSLLTETYEVDANGQVRQLGLAGRGYFAPVLAFRFIRERPDKPIKSWFLEVDTMWLTNYNAGTVSYTQVLFGFRFPFQKLTP